MVNLLICEHKGDDEPYEVRRKFGNVAVEKDEV